MEYLGWSFSPGRPTKPLEGEYGSMSCTIWRTGTRPVARIVVVVVDIVVYVDIVVVVDHHC